MPKIALNENTRVAVLTSVNLSEFIANIVKSGVEYYGWWDYITEKTVVAEMSFQVGHMSRDNTDIHTTTTVTYRELIDAWNMVLMENLGSITVTPDDIDIDADVADMVLQQAVFGCQVYA